MKLLVELQQTPNLGAVRMYNYDDARISHLPAPVRQYFCGVLRSRRPMVAGARVEHAGEFRMTEARWFPFSSTEFFTTQPPGFRWDAQIRIFCGLQAHVLDNYAAGVGSMSAKLLNCVPVMNVSGSPELAAGALQRYLAEAVWFPTALLPSNGVQWDAISHFKACATLTHRQTTASLEFQFNAFGEITSAFTQSRYRYVKGMWQPTPWKCHYSNYADRSGMRIPLAGEVEWQLPDSPLPYWRGRITDVAYEFVETELGPKLCSG
jgi:hypothetical protein